MKKVLLSVSALALVGCSSPLQSQMWERDHVPYKIASEYEKNGISYHTYTTLRSYNISNIEDMKRIVSLFPIYNLIPGYSKEWDGFHDIMQGVKKGDYTVQDISILIETAQSFHNDDPDNLLASPLFANRFNSNIIVPSAKKVHNNEDVERVILHNIEMERSKRDYAEMQRKIEAQREHEAAEKQKYQDNLARFGQDIMDRCGGEIISFNTGFMGQDPYGYVGKCVAMQIPQFLPQQFGRRQWVGPNTLISTIFLGEITNTFVVTADEHIKMSVPLVAIGIDPMQYQNGLGVLQTPVTFKVLRFY